MTAICLPLFRFLTDSRPEIYVRCQKELEIFLDFIKSDPPGTEAFTQMVNNLVVHVQSDHIRLQTMSVHWIRAFVHISGSSLFPYISGVLTAILPNLSYDEEKRRSVSEQEYKSKSIPMITLEHSGALTERFGALWISICYVQLGNSEPKKPTKYIFVA